MKKFLALVAPKAPAYKIDVGEVQGAKYVTRKYSVLKWNKKSTYYFAPAGEKFTKSSEFSKNLSPAVQVSIYEGGGRGDGFPL